MTPFLSQVRDLLQATVKQAPLSHWQHCAAELGLLPVDRGGPAATIAHLKLAMNMSEHRRMAVLLERIPDAPWRMKDLPIAHRALSDLRLRWPRSARLETLARSLHRLDSNHHLAVDNLVRLGLARGRAFSDLVGAYDGLLPDAITANWRGTLAFAAKMSLENGMEDRAAAFFRMLPAADWPPFIQAMRRFVLNETACENASADDLGRGGAPGQPLHQVQALAVEAIDLSMEELFHGNKGGQVSTVERGYTRLVERAGAMPAEPVDTLAVWMKAARDCQWFASRTFGNFSHHADLLQVSPGPAYGTVELKALQTAYRGLNAVAEALAATALRHVLAGTSDCTPGIICTLAELHTDCALLADRPSEAGTMIDNLSGTGIAPDLLAHLRRQCRLQSGQVSSGGPLAFDEPAATALRVRDREDWTRCEGAEWTAILNDPPRRGEFTVLWPNGELQHQDHEVPEVTIAITDSRPLTRIGEGVIIGKGGDILRARRFHFHKDYPVPEGRVEFSAKRGALVDLTGEVTVTEPVLLLDAFDAIGKRNYYHWMVLLLPRIVYAWQQGLLAGRRIVLPDGLSGWMTETIRLCGVPEDRLLVMPTDKPVRFENSILMSSVEGASQTLLETVARRILAATAQPAPDQPRHLYLSRKNRYQRRLTNESEVEELAQRMGFTVLRTETLPITEQARLFAGAKSVVGPEGAALTNTLFCPPGTRVVSILAESDMFPVYNDLSMVLGHPHRKLACRVEPAEDGRFSMWGSYSAHPEVLEQALTWALQGAEA